MLPGERFKIWVDQTAMSFKDRARGWMASWLSFGIEVIMDTIGKRASPMLKPTIERIEQETEIPPELKPIFDELKEPTGEFGALLADSAGSALVGGAIGKILDFLLRPITLAFSYVPGFVLLEVPQLLALWRRGKITEDELNGRLHQLGLGGDTIPELQSLLDTRLDPANWITAFRREYEDFSKIEADLTDQGWSEDRIEALKFTTLFYPAPADLIRWQAREVFEPEMIARYGLDSEFEAIEKEPFYKAGMTDEQILNYWRAHWEHASWMQVVEMLHRGLLTEEQVWDWFRVVEIPPFWRQHLIDTAYTWPTRVDVRRWWDMRTISEQEMISIYHRQGYHGKDLVNYIRWTKVYTDFPMMMARFKNGWINEEDIRNWLKGLEIPPDRIEQFIQEKTKPEEAAVVEEERQLTVTDIIMWLKKYPDEREHAIELIMDLGYSRAAAEFKIAARIAVEAGSPETFEEWKDITQKYKIVTGKEEKPMPEELKKAAAEVVRLTGEVEALERSIEEEKRGLVEGEILPPEATARLEELQVTRNRAISELERVKSEYESKLAEWRHG